MKPDWSPLKSELALWRRDGLDLPIWWRDDDAIADTPRLRQLVQLNDALNCPLHIAVIPRPASADLLDVCHAGHSVIPLVHGWTHESHAPEGTKKAEFGHPRADALAETDAALTRMRALFGVSLLEMFVPPWNRIDGSVVAGLNAQGYRMLSTYLPRPARHVSGLLQINTHIDPIHWRGGGGLADADGLIAGIVTLLQDRRAGKTDAREPLGFLTHHLVHDDAIWAFTKDCLTVLLDGGARACNLTNLKDDT